MVRSNFFICGSDISINVDELNIALHKSNFCSVFNFTNQMNCSWKTHQINYWGLWGRGRVKVGKGKKTQTEWGGRGKRQIRRRRGREWEGEEQRHKTVQRRGLCQGAGRTPLKSGPPPELPAVWRVSLQLAAQQRLISYNSNRPIISRLRYNAMGNE